VLSDVEVEVYAEVRPTESEAKVRSAVLNLIDLDEVEVLVMNNTKFIHGKARGLRSLGKLRELIRKGKIGETAREVLSRSVIGNEVVINANKQAAYVGILSFAMGEVESPLGPITIRIRTSNPQHLITWLTSG
jgi:hypothetical protein